MQATQGNGDLWRLKTGCDSMQRQRTRSQMSLWLCLIHVRGFQAEYLAKYAHVRKTWIYKSNGLLAAKKSRALDPVNPDKPDDLVEYVDFGLI